MIKSLCECGLVFFRVNHECYTCFDHNVGNVMQKCHQRAKWRLGNIRHSRYSCQMSHIRFKSLNLHWSFLVYSFHLQRVISFLPSFFRYNNQFNPHIARNERYRPYWHAPLPWTVIFHAIPVVLYRLHTSANIQSGESACFPELTKTMDLEVVSRRTSFRELPSWWLF